ncbi:MAG: alanine--tRNA ligase, partial [Candidatus Yanofskybacteria bacterium]|nr:alanine--tRNA ligase [Candidatus Yanofskybacteria bacterium]
MAKTTWKLNFQVVEVDLPNYKTDIFLMHDIFAKIVEIYGQYYPNLNANSIIYEFDHEKEKFDKTLRHGLRELEHLSDIDAQSAFRLYESYGLPFEIIKDIVGEKAKSLTREAFEKEFKKHQEISRAGAEKKFGGHGLLMDTGELKAGNEEELKKATRLHTATHLLHAALRKVLDPPAGGEVHQAGSDITPERLRFDFTFPRKMTPEEIKQVEDIVNEAVQKDYPVTKEELSYEDAIKSGAMAFFKLKYPPRVDVYSVGPSTGSGSTFSRELCGGPHVSHSAEIGKFKITKEEAVSAGVRRIRATVD